MKPTGSTKRLCERILSLPVTRCEFTDNADVILCVTSTKGIVFVDIMKKKQVAPTQGLRVSEDVKPTRSRRFRRSK